MSASKVLGDYDSFLKDIIQRVEDAGFDMRDFAQVDHMCYRTVSEENYQNKKQELESIASLIGTNIVNGREIAAFRLNEPVYSGDWRVDIIELPAPKPGSDFPEGLEHIELVIYDDIPKFLKKYDGMDFELRAADRGINPEIGLKLGEYQVKFHLLSLGTVVYLEDKLGITSVKDGESLPQT